MTLPFLLAAARRAALSSILLAAVVCARGAEDARPASSAAAPARENYRLRPTDLLRIEVVDDAQASREVRVAQDGTVRLAYLDQPVKLGGLTVNEAVAAIQNFYTTARVFRKPDIGLVVLEAAERNVQVVGQVNRPGLVAIPPEKELTLVVAVAAAGHLTRVSSGNATIARRLPDGATQLLRVNVIEAMRDPKKDVQLQEGDTIHVREGWFGVPD